MLCIALPCHQNSGLILVIKGVKIKVILKDSSKNYNFELEQGRKFDFNLFSLIKTKEYVKKISF